MNNYDEPLQNKIERRESAGESVDALAYKKVFGALEKEPFMLSDRFADAVVGRLEQKSSWFSMDYFWLAMGLSVFVVATLAALLYLGFNPTSGVLSFLLGHLKFLAFAIVFVLILQYFDRRLVRKGLLSSTRGYH